MIRRAVRSLSPASQAVVAPAVQGGYSRYPSRSPKSTTLGIGSVSIPPMPSTTESGMSGFWTNCGESPWTVRSSRSVSPSCSNASLRISSARPDRLCSLATVKSHVRYRSLRAMPAWPSVLKMPSNFARRASMSGLVVTIPSR